MYWKKIKTLHFKKKLYGQQKTEKNDRATPVDPTLKQTFLPLSLKYKKM